MRQIERSAFVKSKTAGTANRAGLRGKKIAVADAEGEGSTAGELNDGEWPKAKHLALERLLTGLDEPSDHLAYVRARVSDIR